MAGKRKLSADVWFREFILLWLIVAAVSLLAYFAHVRNSGEVQGIEYTADFDTVGSLEKGDKEIREGP